MSDGGKGHTQRPRSKEWDNNYRTVFGESKLERRLREEKEQQDGLPMGHRDLQDGVHILSDQR